MTQKHKTIGWIIFWLYLIPGTVISALMSSEGIKHWVDESVLFSRSPWLVIASGAVFGVLSILGLCSTVLFLRKKNWAVITLFTTLPGILFFGRLLEFYIRKYYFETIVSCLAIAWCVIVAWYCYKRLADVRAAREK